MTLTAKLSERVLTVSGVAASTSGQVRIVTYPLSVKDNDPVTIVVPIDSDGSIVRTIDTRGLEGTGAYINTYSSKVAGVFGSEQDDTIFFYCYGLSGSVYGGGGADYITSQGHAVKLAGGAGNDILIADYDSLNGGTATLIGGSGDDTLSGNAGKDTLNGGRGNDKLDGGYGFDVAIYSGNRADYDLSIAHGALILKDLRRGSPDGTDTFNDVEQLKFADGVLDNLPVATELSATLSERVLTVSGVAALTSRQVHISDSPRVTDNGLVTVVVPVEKDGSTVKMIDARGLDGAGAIIDSYSPNVTGIFGSEQNDAITFKGRIGSVYGGGGADFITGEGRAAKLNGGTGNDTLGANYRGTDGAITLNGGSGHDTLYGGTSNDTLIGGRGNDKLDGRAGSDVAVYSGNRADYDLSIVGQTFVLKDLRHGTYDGTDTIIRVEQLKFADSVLDLTSLATLAHTGL